ncbi:trafficking protein particle complex subunit 10 [Neohortaea acidophila]|uniref:Trafficking protein particle complex subunit 10 n=1 Tax=Neohortaea acidophila TaxID=245834 RepID=A0A6A6PFP3_9PEZI|nr:trafficking protein particle complex subunit 10 [Neohortaea acidophila]KAF2478765.1 trafficking protein particle complex subunit 10 [Neohortaea acidophila]
MDSSSKVTVEYHDPSGIFPLISRDLSSRLPLRNLNWRSQNRPLRQIKSLHLDFVPDSLTKKSLQPPGPQNNSERNTSFDIVGNGGDQRKTNARERRHQIPGLQTSPYLKIYILRCDDKVTYKESERAKVREWIRQSTAAKKKGEHDAFEYLILHVIIPDTVAASEPRWREIKSEEIDDLKERPKQGAKWPGKSSRTVFDKLRADFNESGKNAKDRIAQIRLPKENFPADLLPTPGISSTLKETAEEREKAWIDLIGKIRTLILDPFDQRVRQYEADITEQESRRSMPGFNFCTFFIYKEGLAKALESIGLIEDALVIYDELAVGLELVLRDIASGRAEGTATTFAPYTDDIKERLTGASRPVTNGTEPEGLDGTITISETIEDDYREKIVRSSISVFDFYIYLFSRQKTIILRLANAKAARIQLGLSPKGGSEDLILISEVCWRAASFIHNNARILRADLLMCRDFETTMKLSDADVESLVYLWMYEAAGKVLQETASFALENLPELGSGNHPTNGHLKSPTSGLRVPGGLSAYPSRTSSLRTNSLPPRNSRLAELRNRPSLQSASETDLMARPPSSGSEDATFADTQPGFAELVSYRASLIMMQRKALELLAQQRGWQTGWTTIKRSARLQMSEVALNDTIKEQVNGHGQDHTAGSSLLSPGLESALSSEAAFHETYERLSEDAMRYHITATQAKSAEAVVGDLAILKYHQGNYEAAVSYFQHVLPLYTDGGWNLMEIEALSIYATCLKELGKREEYVRTSLLLLGKVCAKNRTKATRWTKPDVDDETSSKFVGLMDTLVVASRQFDLEVVAPAEQFVNRVRLDRAIQLHDDCDGFSVPLTLNSLLAESLQLDRVSARLASVADPNQTIDLAVTGPVHMRGGSNEFLLESVAVAFGAYRVDRLLFEAGRIRFEHDFSQNQGEPGAQSDILEMPDDPHQNRIFLYPAQEAFKAELSLQSDIQLEATRWVEVRLNSGRNHIDALDLRLKPASAGLRLRLADAVYGNVDAREEEASTPGQLALAALPPHTSAVVQVPYSFEQPADRDILIRFTASYRTSQGAFTFVESFRLPTKLPLSVDVHDNFQFDALVSGFTIRTTTTSPLCVTHAALQSSSAYEVSGPPAISIPMPVFEGEPAKLAYKVIRREVPNDSFKGGNRKDSLALDVTYHLVDEALHTTVLARFQDAVANSPFAHLSRLLTSVMTLNAKKHWTPADTQMALLVHESSIPSFNDIGWEEIIPCLPSEVRHDITTWLKDWHAHNTRIAFGPETGSVGCVRSISIAVDVPSVDVVHRVSLALVEQPRQIKHYPPILPVGQPIHAQLRIASTGIWGRRGDGARSGSSKKILPKNFHYELLADPDAWLVGGQRRGHFVFQEGRETLVELVLIPLRLGFLSLPSIDVQPEAPEQQGTEGAREDGRGPGDAAATITTETHYESRAEVVQVFRNEKTTRVDIPETAKAMTTTTTTRPVSRLGSAGTKGSEAA